MQTYSKTLLDLCGAYSSVSLVNCAWKSIFNPHASYNLKFSQKVWINGMKENHLS